MPNKYKKNFLDRVIFRIDFDVIELSKLKVFYDQIKGEFPIQNLKSGIEGSLNFNLKSGHVEQARKEFVTYNFENKKRNKVLEIAPKYLLLSYNSCYKNSEELTRDINKHVLNFIKLFNIKTINRIGLRYINKIALQEGNPIVWDDYINRHLLGNFKIAKDLNLKFSRSMNQIVIRNDDSDIVFNFGIWNEEYPSEIITKVFILDYDCFSRFPNNFDEHPINEIVTDYNNKIEKLFESSITDDFRKLLNN